MTKPASTNKKPRKQHAPEFRHEALKPAERIFVISMLQCRVPPGEPLAGYTMARVTNKQLFPLITNYAPPHRGIHHSA
ncbi:hypothetical protein [Salmonella enterica]|uniref:Uncharacterized protein n=1 Tax=Salmonella enterica subsp. salamae serovar 55:k:z39 str. 1315K TaxID=1243602 RepID=A0A6C7C866_SALER|nr:hypothetical protein [Salmonella enterica]ECC1695668.1 hypothetical protein [Salmonella enterica subsp. salamae]ASG90652.1 hypothetical protein LFZ47_24640 [Salmonella enterica subsp. salamae serovar 55:k:z39 str. 1315K]ECI4078799.1 hypothetical protein [Salmonella enterica subsp. salamae]EDV5907237.1 hypothetical protein [Salmonella enterica subsp. salamae]EEL7720971.1 hypothetical protein [Salmonella enterica]